MSSYTLTTFKLISQKCTSVLKYMTYTKLMKLMMYLLVVYRLHLCRNVPKELDKWLHAQYVTSLVYQVFQQNLANNENHSDIFILY